MFEDVYTQKQARRAYRLIYKNAESSPGYRAWVRRSFKQNNSHSPKLKQILKKAS